MDWGATNDPITSTSDVFVLPEYNDTGIYLLEDAGNDTNPRRETRERPLSRVRMRRGAKEGFGSRPTATQSFRQYQASIPGQMLLKSSRRGYADVEEAGWDNRPRGFRPDDDAKWSAFYPPPYTRPPLGGIITPWEVSYAPSYTEAIMKASVPDPNMVGLAPCGALPTLAHKGWKEPPPLHPPTQPNNIPQKEPFMGGGSQGCISTQSITLGLQMVKIVIFFIVVVLLALWVVTAASEKRMGRRIRHAIRDAVAELRKA